MSGKKIVILIISFLAFHTLLAQQQEQDSFFLAKKKGIWGKLGRSISTNDVVDAPPVKTKNQFEAYKGKTIRSIRIETLPFNVDINDTAGAKKENFGVRVANALHKNSTIRTISRYLFFKEGDKVLPFQLADNAHYLREQPFLQDALILIYPTTDKDKVDIAVLTSDVFSIGADLDFNTTRAKTRIKEENFVGTGNHFSAGVIFDKEREPKFGYGAEYLQRNVGGKFFNWKTGFTNFAPAYNYGHYEETGFYTEIDKPLVSRYTLFTGGISFGYHKNNYNYHFVNDSVFKADRRYVYLGTDAWLGYNIGALTGKNTDSYNRLRHFLAARALYTNFFTVPDIFSNTYNYNYADINGALFSYSLFKQNFYRSNFIYGFGRNEDVPVGLNATATIGFTNKQGNRRMYWGFNFSGTTYTDMGNFSEYIFRFGGYTNVKRFQDIDLLLSYNRFSKLHKLSPKWRQRFFLGSSVTSQFKPFLNTPLFLASGFGMPYFNNGDNFGDFRSTVKVESVFYNLKKYLGFRFAPFVFTDAVWMRLLDKSFRDSRLYQSIGGGIRTRNENLIFGTLEAKGYYFPKITPGMKHFRFEFGSNIRIKYSSDFIRKPDFIIAN